MKRHSMTREFIRWFALGCRRLEDQDRPVKAAIMCVNETRAENVADAGNELMQQIFGTDHEAWEWDPEKRRWRTRDGSTLQIILTRGPDMKVLGVDEAQFING